MVDDASYLEAFPFEFADGEGDQRVELKLVNHGDHFHLEAREGSAEEVTRHTSIRTALLFTLRGAFLMAAEGYPCGWGLAHYVSSYQRQYAAASKLEGLAAANCAGSGRVH